MILYAVVNHWSEQRKINDAARQMSWAPKRIPAVIFVDRHHRSVYYPARFHGDPGGVSVLIATEAEPRSKLFDMMFTNEQWTEFLDNIKKV